MIQLHFVAFWNNHINNFQAFYLFVSDFLFSPGKDDLFELVLNYNEQ